MINNLFYIDKVMKRISKFFLKEKKVESFFFIFKIWVVISIYFFWINEDILIGMYNKQEVKIVWFESIGKELEIIQRNSKIGEDLYCYFYYIIEGLIGDVCVFDFEKFFVIIVNRKGEYKFIYKGFKKVQFFLYGICIDKVGNILVCDNQCKYRIYMLDFDGVFLRFFLFKDDGILELFGLCIDDCNNFWFG